MAERRMLTQKIIDSDAFLDMPLSTQALYMHLNMRADDDGFVNNPKRIQRTIGASEDDLKLLLAKRFIIGFDSGVIVIKHWRMHNTLRKDRYNPTQYQDELKTLEIKENSAYTERIATIPKVTEESVATTWQPNGNHLEPQDRIGKDSLVEFSLGEFILPPDSDESERPAPPKNQKRKHGIYKNVALTDSEFDKLREEFGKSLLEKAITFLDEYIEEKGYKSKSHNLAIRRWVLDAVKDREAKASNAKQQPKQESGNVFLDGLERGDFD